MSTNKVFDTLTLVKKFAVRLPIYVSLKLCFFLFFYIKWEVKSIKIVNFQ